MAKRTAPQSHRQDRRGTGAPIYTRIDPVKEQSRFDRQMARIHQDMDRRQRLDEIGRMERRDNRRSGTIGIHIG